MRVTAPAVRVQVAGDDPQQRRLAGAVRADQRGGGAVADPEGHVVQQRPAVRQRERHLVDVDVAHVRRVCPSAPAGHPGSGRMRRWVTSLLSRWPPTPGTGWWSSAACWTTTRRPWRGRRSRRSWPTPARWPWSPAARTTPDGSSRTSAAGPTLADLGRLARHPSIAATVAQLMAATHVRLFHDHVLVKEPHRSAHAVAPGPALLQRVGPADGELVDPGGPGPRRRIPRGGRRDARRAVAPAAHLPRRRGEVVPRGLAGRAARHRRRPCRLPHPHLGAQAGRRDRVPLPVGPRRRRLRRRVVAACCRSATWATTPAMRHGSGPPRPTSPA